MKQICSEDERVSAVISTMNVVPNAVRERAMLESAPSREFDGLVGLALKVFDVAWAAISLIDGDIQWIKATQPVPDDKNIRTELLSACSPIFSSDALEILDTKADPRFQDLGCVDCAQGIRYFARVPLTLSDGTCVGALCLADTTPRELSRSQTELFLELATNAVNALEAHRAELSVRRRQLNYQAVVSAIGAATLEWNLQTGELRVNEQWAEIVGQRLQDIPHETVDDWLDQTHPDDLPPAEVLLQLHIEGKSAYFHSETRRRHRNGRWIWVSTRGRILTWTEGAPEWMFAVQVDISDRKDQELALRRSEKFLSRAGEVAGVGGWELDLVAQTVTWSEQTCRIHGVEPGYQPDLNTAIEFYAPESRPIVQAAVEQSMLDGKPWDLELQLIRKDGAQIWVRAVGHAEFIDKTPIRLLGAIQDITTAVTQRQALETTHHRFDLATRSGAIGVWDYDLVNDRSSWSDRMYELYGEVRTNEHTREVWARRVHPDDRDRMLKAWQDALDGTKSFDEEYRVVWPDGSVHFLHVAGGVIRDGHGKPLRKLGVASDISDRKRTEAALAESEARFRAMTSAAPQIVWTATHDGRVDFFNQTGLDYIGLTLPQLLGNRWLGAVHPDDLTPLLETWAASLATGSPCVVQFRVRRRDGEYRWHITRSVAELDDNGRPKRWYGFSTEIEELKRAQHRAEEATQVKSAFLSSMSHEIRTPMNAVIGMTSILLESPLSNEQREQAEIIRTSGEHLLSVINDILDYSKIEAGSMDLERTPFSVRDCLESAIDLASVAAKQKRVELGYMLPANAPDTVQGDVGRLRQVLVNLLSNAVKFTPSGGQVSLDIKPSVDSDGQFSYLFEVRDTGIGIATEIIPTLFSAFTQADTSTTREYGGTGLGLSISRRLVELMEGIIGVESTVGIGSRFFLQCLFRSWINRHDRSWQPIHSSSVDAS